MLKRCKPRLRATNKGRTKLTGTNYNSLSGNRGKPADRRLFAGHSKTHPMLTYWTNHTPYNQMAKKHVDHTNNPSRYIPDEQLYSNLEWESHDDTPELLHRSSSDLKDYGKAGADYWNGYHFSAGRFMPPYGERPVQLAALDLATVGRTQYPLVPKTDSRVLSNEQWQSAERQERVRLLLQKHQLFDFFPDVASDINMNINFGGDDPRSYWRSVHMGNFIELGHVLKRPRVVLPSDGVDPDARFTLMMFSPDHPFRPKPDAGHCLHWAVANLKAGDAVGEDGLRRDSAVEGRTVVPYQHPLPSEDAGCLRYVFALFRQERELTGLPPVPDRVPLQRRRNFVLHSETQHTDALAGSLSVLGGAISDRPVALTFMHTEFDYEVAEWYQAADEPEPLWIPEDLREAVSGYVRKARFIARHTPYGMSETQQSAKRWDRTHLYPDV